MEILFRVLIVVLIFFINDFQQSYGQPLRNLDFEKKGIVYPDRPLGWHIFERDFKVTLDSTETISGRFSLKSKTLSESDAGLSTGSQQIPVEIVQGKKLKISGWIRTENVDGGVASIWLDMIDGEGNRNLKNLPDDGLTGTNTWQKYETELVVEPEAETIYLGVFHNGSGEAWFDDLKVTIDGEVFDPDSYEPWMASTEEMDWLKENAIPLNTDDPGSGFEDLNLLQDHFYGAKIIGLGEATHGTREFFRMKHRFVEWFAQQADTTIFVIEASMPEARIINDYVMYGKGDPKEALAGMHFWVWNSQEVLDLIEWMRDYNQSGQGRVEFWGNDLQFPHLAADSVEVFIKDVDPEYVNQLNDHYATIRQIEDEELRRMSQEQLKEIYDEVSNVRSHIELNKANYLSLIDEMSVEWTIQNARIVEQVVTRLIHDEDSRDKSMALNTEWIYNHRVGDRSNMVIWAHNAHVWYNEGWMGYYLAEIFGDLYRSVGFGFGEGKYTAVAGLEVPVNSYPTPPVPKGAVEYALRSLELPVLAVDLRSISNHSLGKWLLEPKPFKFIGSVALEDPYSNTRLAKEYDLLIYFDQTTASRSFGRP